MHSYGFRRCITALSVGVGVVSSIAVPNQAIAQTPETASTIPGSFACLNNPNPYCGNPVREMADTEWACFNNPGPACTVPPRIDEDLVPGNWNCQNNQNVVRCENPIRYTVDDVEAWPTYFINY